MFNTFKFAKPKTPGFGISRHFYLTVLAAKMPLPSVASLVNPEGTGGAVLGFGVPLCDTACKELLVKPMERGSYAIATKDRKTLLKCLVISKEEAGFDPEPFARSVEALNASPELVNRIRATWTLIQLSFESHDPMVAPSLDFLLRFAQRAADLSDGAIADPISQRYLLPADIALPSSADLIDPVAHVSLRSVAEPTGLRVFTLGLQKFGIQEVELGEVPDSLLGAAETLLMGIAENALKGKLPGLGDWVGTDGRKCFELVEGGLNRGRWEGIPVLELIPARGTTVADQLQAL